ncbi:MAG: gamma-glutamyl-gamma-aminobutyrate hydrolase family protein, partial [Gammaproteobacteria bacterium]|nr:gamma-glutamyl-gamma-aminobutyrate hydrolase family protein [Gammaproteobacteria bacterium]
EIIGSEARQVNSFHGRAVDRLGPGLTVAAHSPDGVVEALERPDKSFVIGIQWHPERQRQAFDKEIISHFLRTNEII